MKLGFNIIAFFVCLAVAIWCLVDYIQLGKSSDALLFILNMAFAGVNLYVAMDD